MKVYYSEMLAYERWANERVLAWLEDHPNHPELTKIFAHLIGENLPWIYLMRGKEVPADINPEPDWSLVDCRTQLESMLQALEYEVDRRDDFSDPVRTTGKNGVVFEHTVGEILTSLLNHAEHHRGEIQGIVSRDTGEYIPSVYMCYLRANAAA